jgi:hypothetical protein
MTDRHAGYIVTLDHDIREDDAQRIIEAIEMIKHVISVKPIVATFELQNVQERVRYELQAKLLKVVRESFNG